MIAAQIKRATVAASSSGANTLVAAVPGKRIQVIAGLLMSNGSVNTKFQSHVTGDVSGSGLAYLVANTGFVLPPNEHGWFETIISEALDLNLSANVAVGGIILYIEL